MKKHTSYVIMLSAFAMILASCGSDNTTSTKENKDKELKTNLVTAPDFNADTAFHFIEKQVSFGPRVPNSDAHAKCAAYLEKTLRKYTSHVFVQKGEVKAFDGKILK